MDCAKPQAERFGEVHKQLLEDTDIWLIRRWCERWNLPPNDPRILDIEIEEIERWLTADDIVAWVIKEEDRKLEEATFEKVYPFGEGTKAELFERVEAEMGGPEEADPEEVEAEVERRWAEQQKQRKA